MKRIVTWGGVAGLVLSTACGPGRSPAASNPNAGYLQSTQQRVLAPGAPPADQASVAAGNTAFALDLFGAVRGTPGNLFFSPYSLSLAAAMAYAGAGGETAQQMAGAFHYALPEGQLAPAFDAVDLSLNAAESPLPQQTGQPFSLHVADTFWGQRGYPFLSSYLDTLAAYYGAGIHTGDFASNPDAVRGDINGWVSGQTNAAIPELLGPGTVSNATVAVLVNAVYFAAGWNTPFDPKQTQSASFHLLDGTSSPVPMMSATFQMPLFQGSGYSAVDLPYVGGRMAMLVVVPDAGQFDAFQAGLTPAVLGQITSGLSLANVALSFPRFSASSQLAHLPQTLEQLGMVDAFDPSKADFSGVDGSRDLFISDVIHQAFLSVDENGTEAAAATAILSAGGVPTPPAPVVVDRPFFVFIHDLQSATVLFVGRIVTP